MTEANTQILIGLATAVTDALTALQAINKKVADQNALIAEYQRQMDVHLANNDIDDKNVAEARRNDAWRFLQPMLTSQTAAQTAYDDAVARYNTAKNTVLTPEEKQEVIINATNNAAIALAEQKIKAEQAKTAAAAQALKDKANYADKTGQTVLIIGIVFVVIIVVSYFIWRAKKKKIIQ